MIGTILKLALAAWSWWTSRNDQNIGRQLEQTDDLKASVKADQNAVQTSQDVAGLSDTALDNELRRPPATNR